jgi:hypothetical protein
MDQFTNTRQCQQEMRVTTQDKEKSEQKHNKQTT